MGMYHWIVAIAVSVLAVIIATVLSYGTELAKDAFVAATPSLNLTHENSTSINDKFTQASDIYYFFLFFVVVIVWIWVIKTTIEEQRREPFG